MNNMNFPPQLFAALASALRASAGTVPGPGDAGSSVLGNLALEISPAGTADEGLRTPARLKACSGVGARFECGRPMSVDDQFVAFIPIRGAQIPLLYSVIASSLVSSNRWLIESEFVSLQQTADVPDAREKEMERIRRSILG